MNLPQVTTLTAVLLSASALTVREAQDAKLEKRVEQLENWRPAIEKRLRTLEESPRKVQGIGDERAERLLSVTVRNKRFDKNGSEDDRPWRQVATIWWDATYEAYELEKDTRSIQGVLQFCDLFGDPQFECRVTLNETLRVGGKHRAPTGGIDFDPRDKAHEWLLATRLEDMTFTFKATRVLYMDGTREEFEER